MLDDHNFKLSFCNETRTVSDKELIYMLSSGTTKGMLLYILMAASLQQGFDLIIDEIENHFHKTLVENMISLYKDKTVNRNNATLIFTTHYCELLDLFLTGRIISILPSPTIRFILPICTMDSISDRNC